MICFGKATVNCFADIAGLFLSGTTWTQQIIHQLLRNGAAGGSYGETVPWLEATASDFLQLREAPTWTLDKINNAPSGLPRYFKTHATINHLPRGSANIKGMSPRNIRIATITLSSKNQLLLRLCAFVNP